MIMKFQKRVFLKQFPTLNKRLGTKCCWLVISVGFAENFKLDLAIKSVGAGDKPINIWRSTNDEVGVGRIWWDQPFSRRFDSSVGSLNGLLRKREVSADKCVNVSAVLG